MRTLTVTFMKNMQILQSYQGVKWTPSEPNLELRLDVAIYFQPNMKMVIQPNDYMLHLMFELLHLPVVLALFKWVSSVQIRVHLHPHLL